MSIDDVNRLTEQTIKKQNEEAMFNNQRKEKADEEDDKKRLPLDQRFRKGLHKMAYGEQTNLLHEAKDDQSKPQAKQ